MNTSKNEIYIFIIWEKARIQENHILNDLSKKFSIMDVIEITWSKIEFLNNLKRFYGKTLPDAKEKAELCGTGSFLLVVVSDPNPKFIEPSQSTISSKDDYVNINILNCKNQYRKLIGKNYTVHSSVSKNETNHNLTLLFGKNLQDFEKSLPNEWDKKIKKTKCDLIGNDDWKDMNQLLYVLNGTVNYVILRNFEEMPNEFDFHDVDLLVEDEKLVYIVKKDFLPKKDNPRSIEIKVGSENITLNPNYIGDHYYDEKWEHDILKRRIFHPNGFYIPCNSDYFFTLLYHVIFHERWKKISSIRDDYKKILLNLANTLQYDDLDEMILNNKLSSKLYLEKYMKKSSYSRTDVFRYKMRHNESSRLVKTSFFILQTHGFRTLIFAIKEKIKLILKLRY